MKKKMYTLAVVSLTLLVTASGGSVAASPDTTASASEDSDKSSPDSTESMTLYIGHTGELKEVSRDCEAAPDALIEALAEETGWDLTLAGPVTQEEYDGVSYLTVAFAKGSAIYSQPPEKQKDDYLVSDAEELIYLVLNSTAETLRQNLGIDDIYFTSPDGGNLDFENGGYAFYLCHEYPWDEETVQVNNEPLPKDSIGRLLLSPSGDILMDSENLSIVFKRGNIKPGSGNINIYNEDGTVFSQYDVSDAQHVEAFDLSEEQKEYTGWKDGCGYYVWLDKPFEAGKSYNLSIDAGAFTADGLSTREIPKGNWMLTCLDYGFGECSEPVNGSTKLGDVITQEVIFGDKVERVELKAEDPEMGTVCAEPVTGDGTVTLTPKKAGNFVVHYTFILKDGSTYETLISYDIIE